jgi:hypothetical protein
LNTDPTTRFTIKEIRSHEWFNQVKPTDYEGIIVGKDPIPVIDEALITMMRDMRETIT